MRAGGELVYASAMALHRVTAVAFALVLAGCGSKKPSAVKGVPPVPPDESYQLGSIGYQEGFLWTCAASEHVHVWRTCGEMIGCGKWQIEHVACGAPLASEPPKSERLAMKYGTWE